MCFFITVKINNTCKILFKNLVEVIDVEFLNVMEIVRDIYKWLVIVCNAEFDYFRGILWLNN